MRITCACARLNPDGAGHADLLMCNPEDVGFADVGTVQLTGKWAILEQWLGPCDAVLALGDRGQIHIGGWSDV